MNNDPLTNLRCLQLLPDGTPCEYRTDHPVRMQQHQDDHLDGQRGVVWDNCVQCGNPITLISLGFLRVHGPRNRRCPGSGQRGTFGRPQ